jgi:hypothetical protein
MSRETKYLDTLSLVDALWWFIENAPDSGPERTEMFFYLRERYRSEVQS